MVDPISSGGGNFTPQESGGSIPSLQTVLKQITQEFPGSFQELAGAYEEYAKAAVAYEKDPSSPATEEALDLATHNLMHCVKGLKREAVTVIFQDMGSDVSKILQSFVSRIESGDRSVVADLKLTLALMDVGDSPFHKGDSQKAQRVDHALQGFLSQKHPGELTAALRDLQSSL